MLSDKKYVVNATQLIHLILLIAEKSSVHIALRRLTKGKKPKMNCIDIRANRLLIIHSVVNQALSHARAFRE